MNCEPRILSYITSLLSCVHSHHGCCSYHGICVPHLLSSTCGLFSHVPFPCQLVLKFDADGCEGGCCDSNYGNGGSGNSGGGGA